MICDILFPSMQDFPNYFADANSNFKNAKYVIFGIPYDKTTYFRKGTIDAPDEIRKASWSFESFDIKTGLDFTEIPVHDFGNIQTTNNDKPGIMIKKVEETIRTILAENMIPIGMGGEHSATVGVIKAFKEIGKNIGVISLDAHVDFRNEFENSKYNHACVMRRLSEIVGIENIAVLGIRSGSKEEMAEANDVNLFYIEGLKILEKGVEWSVNQALKHLKNQQIYLTIDMDVLDPAFAPAVSTPEPFGLNAVDVLQYITLLSDRLVGCDIVEVSPPYDTGQTSILAAKLLRSVIFETWKN